MNSPLARKSHTWAKLFAKQWYITVWSVVAQPIYPFLSVDETAISNRDISMWVPLQCGSLTAVQRPEISLACNDIYRANVGIRYLLNKYLLLLFNRRNVYPLPSAALLFRSLSLEFGPFSFACKPKTAATKPSISFAKWFVFFFFHSLEKYILACRSIKSKCAVSCEHCVSRKPVTW